MAFRSLSIFATAILIAGSTLACAAVADSQSAATEYMLDPGRSNLKFLFRQAGAENQGMFRKYAVKLRIDDANLAASELEVDIDVDSLDTSDQDRDQTLRGADLFNVAKFPKAHFKAEKITRSAAGRYDAPGKLTIRNVTRDVTVSFTFRTVGEKNGLAGYMTGHASLNRLDFGVGQGEWQATDQVANEVQVTFGLRFTPEPPSPAPVK